ncbi:MucB/RseB C-terminal domain-containing protein [Candidatus Thiosymbion oneisti]|uniref:MucB/RseB C-terminal domain-containing protein n=1 Tax=Candidatus Thiosymbion oneisti TaxID=589554 RepID=UPI000B19D8F7|nr:MucB/RseB C-terminal domain-containing protein [Candidatus Thiosymbion oneisti]
MSEQQRRHLSALVDGEIDPTLVPPTLSALESNERLIAAWEGYHLIGAAMRSEQIRPEYRLLRSRVSERVAAEPPLQRPVARRGRVLRLRPLAGAALVACAVSAAVVAVPRLFNLGPAAEPPPSRHTAASAPERFRLVAPARRWHVDEPALEGKLDRESGLPLKSDLMGQQTDPIEQVMFTSLDLLPSQGTASTAGPVPQQRRYGPEPPVPGLLPWRFDALPPGFSLVMHNDWRAADGQPVDHFVLSDGLASVSVYVEAGNPQAGLEGGTHIGAVHAVGKRVSDHQVTVVGEVPPETVEAVLAGLRHAPGGRR